MYDFVCADSSISLTKAEKEALHYLMQGDTQAQAAVRLGISERSVNRRLESVRRKTKCKSTIETVVFVLQNRLI
jgi:DNA-binding CsgD family transcriptional regulator